MGKSTLHIATRRPNGNIGYISEALELPEFFDLIRPIGEQPYVLADFSPVIEALHKLHSNASASAIRNTFNSNFNYWQESKSYKSTAIRLTKCEKVMERSNELINTLQSRLQEKEGEFRGSHEHAARLKVVQSIKQDADMYIVTLLCLIHSKASLEIESFREDAVITSYGDFILSLSDRLYRSLLAGREKSEEFLRYLAFELGDKLPAHLALLKSAESEDEFLLRTLREQSPSTQYGQTYDGQPCSWRQVSITYGGFDHAFTCMAEILKDLIYRTRSVQEFIQRLKSLDVSWDNSDETIQALAQEVRYAGGQPFAAYPLR